MVYLLESWKLKTNSSIETNSETYRIDCRYDWYIIYKHLNNIDWCERRIIYTLYRYQVVYHSVYPSLTISRHSLTRCLLFLTLGPCSSGRLQIVCIMRPITSRKQRECHMVSAIMNHAHLADAQPHTPNHSPNMAEDIPPAKLTCLAGTWTFWRCILLAIA